MGAPCSHAGKQGGNANANANGTHRKPHTLKKKKNVNPPGVTCRGALLMEAAVGVPKFYTSTAPWDLKKHLALHVTLGNPIHGILVPSVC